MLPLRQSWSRAANIWALVGLVGRSVEQDYFWSIVRQFGCIFNWQLFWVFMGGTAN